jgi:hypothetical protein
MKPMMKIMAILIESSRLFPGRMPRTPQVIKQVPRMGGVYLRPGDSGGLHTR